VVVVVLVTPVVGVVVSVAALAEAPAHVIVIAPAAE
jgi:hypothetical protein